MFVNLEVDSFNKYVFKLSQHQISFQLYFRLGHHRIFRHEVVEIVNYLKRSQFEIMRVIGDSIGKTKS